MEASGCGSRMAERAWLLDGKRWHEPSGELPWDDGCPASLHPSE
jgi:hypothetical protein